MKLSQDVQLKNMFRRWAFRLSLIPGVMGLLVITGWLTGVGFLARLGSFSTPMYPLTALNFIAVSVAYFSLFYQRKKIFRVLGFSLTAWVFFSGIFELFESITKLSSLDPSEKITGLLTDTSSQFPITVLAPSVALGFILCAAGLLLNNLPRTFNYKIVHHVILFLFTLGVLALLGYLYGAEKLYGIIFSVPMSLPSGVCFTVFSLALLFLRPERGLMIAVTSSYTGSLLLRTLIPAVIVLPALLGAMAVRGFELGVYDGEHGSVYFVFTMMVAFVSLVIFSAYLINKREVAKAEVDRALYESEAQIRTIFENAPEAVIVIDEAGDITRWNPEATRLFGWTSEEAIGQSLSLLLVPPAFREAHAKGMQRYHQTGLSNVLGKTLDIQAEKKNGGTLDVLLKISSFSVGGKKYFVGFLRDITERKKMETRLQQFNELLSREVEEKTQEHIEMLERVTDGFIALDVQLHFIYVNSKAAQIMRKQPYEMVGAYIWEVFPGGRGRQSDLCMQQALQTQQHVRMYDFVEAYDLWLEINMYPSRNGLSIFLKDISEQKKKEEEVLEARELADKLIDSLPGVFYFYDDSGKFIRWNKALEEVTGYTSEEIEAIHPVQLFPENEQEYIKGRIQTVFEKGANHAEANFISKHGHKTPYYFRAGLLQYKGKSCLLGTGIDITEKIKAEQVLKLSEQKYKLMFEGNPLPMWILSLPEYKVLDVNQACLKQYGYTRQEFMRLDMKALLPVQDHDKMFAHMNRSFRGLHRAGVWRHQTKQQDILYADIVTHDIYDQGKATRLVLAKDVTEQYLAEERLRNSYDEIKKLTEYLQKVREEERTRISREIHDEVGQLVTAIKMDIAWINRHIPETETRLKKKVEDALSYTDFMVASVRRIAAELRPSVLDDLGLQAAIKWQIDNFRNLYNIPVHADLNVEGVALSEEQKVGLFRILQESLTNVARHAEASSVKISLNWQKGFLKLVISDNGKGFDMHNRPGKTLGLLGMKERVEGLGGTYSITSKIQMGTTVNVEVPIPYQGGS